MGYYLQDGVCSQERTSADFPGIPKSHTPDSPLKERGYRFYKTDVGRWLSRDPIGEIGGRNVYAAFRNAPQFIIDLLGLLSTEERETKFKSLLCFLDGLLEFVAGLTDEQINELTRNYASNVKYKEFMSDWKSEIVPAAEYFKREYGSLQKWTILDLSKMVNSSGAFGYNPLGDEIDIDLKLFETGSDISILQTLLHEPQHDTFGRWAGHGEWIWFWGDSWSEKFDRALQRAEVLAEQSGALDKIKCKCEAGK